ncbi:MAG: glycosyltransferase [Chitinophagaceae bacterium]|jgi:GT2 family glycosyltransferase|nr:glycosyltransferase [Chitinophagaceae bacterium]
MDTGISVIIPNYNGALLLPQILPCALEALAQAGEPGEVIVVDDASTDDSVRMVRQHFPAVQVIERKLNGGFSQTANTGIAAARFNKTLLLNSDVKLSPGYFAPLLRYFDKPDTFGVMGRVVGWDDEIIQDGAKFPSFHGAKIKTARNYLLLDEAAMHDGIFSMYLSGANALMDTRKLRTLGGFDEIFSPFYVEDYELSLRAWRMGWICYYEHQAICRHRVSVTIKSQRRKRFVDTIYDRNKMILHALHLQGWRLLAWYLQLLPELLIRLFTGRFFFVRALVQFVGKAGLIRQRRKALQQLAVAHGLLSVEVVMEKVKQSFAGQQIRIF